MPYEYNGQDFQLTYLDYMNNVQGKGEWEGKRLGEVERGNGERLGEVDNELFQIVHGESSEDSGSFSPLAMSINQVRIVNRVERHKKGGTSHSTQSSDKSAATTTGAESNSEAPAPLASQTELKLNRNLQRTGSFDISFKIQKNGRNKTLLKPCLKAHSSYSHTYSDGFVQNLKHLGIAPDISQKAEEFKKKRLRFHIPSSKQTALSYVLTQTVWEPDATIPRFEFFNFNALVCLPVHLNGSQSTHPSCNAPSEDRIPADWSGALSHVDPCAWLSPYQSHNILTAENFGTECGRSS